MQRRQFLETCAAAVGTLALPPLASASTQAPARPRRPLKLDIYGRHLLWLRNPDEVAAMAKETGYDGLDINVRPGDQGHVAPDRVTQDLPPFVAAIRKAGLAVSAITPPITDADSPYAEDILATASSIGITHYW